MFQRGFFLVVTPNEGLASSLLDTMQRYVVTRRTHSLEEALMLLSDHSKWSGLVLDLDMHMGQELAMLDRVRQAHPLVNTLALSSKPSLEVINAVHCLRMELACKPLGHANIDGFMRRAMVHGWLPDERIAAWVDELARRHGLTAREVQLMAYALGDEPRRTVMRRLGITENTLKTQVRGLLRKCGARSMDALARNVLRDALLHDDFQYVPTLRPDDSGEFPTADHAATPAAAQA